VHTPGGPEALRYEEIERPAPGPGQVLVKIEAAGVNFIDVYQRTGHYKVPLPVTLGQEAAGTVSAVGPGVAARQVGEGVAYASRAAGELRVRRQDDVRERLELPRAPGHDGLVRSVERTGGTVRPAGAEPEGLVIPHPAHAGALHRDARRAARAGRRGVGLDQE